MNKSFYMQAISGNYPWMKMGASVVAWIYFYKWLCIDRHCLLEIKSLEETKNYVKEQLKKEKAKRKFTRAESHYIYFLIKMFQVMDSRSCIITTNIGLVMPV
jgi:hypothetical protein